MRFYIIAIMCFFCVRANGQILQPVKWSYASKTLKGSSAIIYFKADIDPEWHIYSVNQVDGGPVKTSFKYATSKDYVLNGGAQEPTPITHFEKAFGINVLYFTKTVTFKQLVKVQNKRALIKGRLRFMACNDHQCLPPEDIEFTVKL